jgi:outer membrane protein assembly factor BamB
MEKRKAMMKRPNILLIIGCCALILLSCLKNEVSDNSQKKAESSDWRIFRGDSRLSGIAEGKLPERFELLWSFKTEDDIKSSPVIGSDRVYIGSDDGNVYALNLNDGTKIWNYDTGSAVEAPPLLVDQIVYVGNLYGTLFAVDALTGEFKWRYETDSQISGSANWVTTSNGKDKWILVGSYDNMMHCVHAATGEKMWGYETDNYINGAPATDGSYIIFGGCDAHLHVVAAETGQKIAGIDAESYIAGSAALIEERAYLGHYGDKLICIDISEKKVVWEYFDEEEGAAFFSSPAVSDDRVVIGSRDMSLHCVRRKDGQRIWKFCTRDDVDSSPVICDNKVVVGSTDGRLYIVNLLDGTEVWSYEIGASITSSPAVAGEMIVIGAEDGRVYAFGGVQ